jgi:hypothetical protein
MSPVAFQLGPALALTAPPPMMLGPFMSQIEVWPLVLWKRMSDDPSPPVPMTCQAGPGLALTVPPPIKVLPFISQIETWPLVVFWKRMSEWPS